MINTRYEIIRKIGEGRSKVYLCRDIEFPGKDYAMKILSHSKDEHEKNVFIKEFFILKKLEHPFIIKAFDIGTVFHTDGEDGIETGSTFLTMEFFNGHELLSSKNIGEERYLREVVKQICSVLYYLHQSRYIYYDLKPENILLSFDSGIPEIRLIDLGLAEYSPSSSEYEIKGTAYYIAPELLKKENHNNSVDFYSLGIILYQIIYGRYPYEAKSELAIYKSAIEHVFDYPSTESFSQEFIKIVSKLLEKDIEKRYSSALSIINDLGFTLDISITKEFLPAKVFTCRDYAVNILSKFISSKSSSEVYTIKGFDGVGKTSLLHRMHQLYPQAIFISDVKGKSAEQLIHYMLRQLVFSESIYQELSGPEKHFFLELLRKDPKEIIENFRTSIIQLSSKNKFILLLDDFNQFDQLAIDLILEIIPLFQINNVRIILTEVSDHKFFSSKINNVREINLGAFTKDEMTDFLRESYKDDFPVAELRELIATYADLVPGNIKSFINDLILLGILRFTAGGVDFNEVQEKLPLLNQSNFAVYDFRLKNLTQIERFAARIISSLDVYIDSSVLSFLLGLSIEQIEKVISNLQFNNIIQRFTSGRTLVFTSEAIKKYIYSSIDNKKEIHLQIGKKLKENVLSFNRLELARQYELANEFEQCFNISMEEIKEAEKHSALSYIQRILVYLSRLPLDKELIAAVKFKLVEVYFTLGDLQSSLLEIRELKKTLPQNKIDKKMFIIEGSVLIASGDYHSGKAVISGLLQTIEDEEEKNRLKVELAYADFELKMYKEAGTQCNHLLGEKNLSDELKGRCFNLKGMIEIYQKGDLNSALASFQKAKSIFEQTKQPVRVAGAEVNIGNVYNILTDYEKAEAHWQQASKINQSIGNLEQEGMLLQSMGVFYLNRQKFNLAVESYQKALNIFISIGKVLNKGQVLYNLAEVYLLICEYQYSLNNLLEARKIFQDLENFEELSDVLFLLAKFYYKIGFYEKMKETYSEIKLTNSAQNHLVENKTYTKLLEQWISFVDKSSVSTDQLLLICKELIKKEDIINLGEAISLLVNYYIKSKNYDRAIEEINRSEIMDICSQNSILEAQREYFSGIISKNYTTDKLLPPLVHLEKAYDLVKDESVTEITWKVLSEISEQYYVRGMLNKAKRFIIYTRELIFFIAENIESPRLRAAYLRQEDRMRTLEKLENFYPQK